MKGLLKFLAIFLIAFALFSAGYLVRFLTTPSLPPEFDLIEQTWQLLKQNYVEPGALDPKKLAQGAVKGMLRELGDPYVTFLDPKERELKEKALAGKYEGIGAQVGIIDNRFIILSTMPGQPAQEAGIKSGDQILAVDGQPVEGLSLTELILKIRGPAGTTVRLTILREGKPIELEVKRRQIEAPSLFHRKEKDIGYIKLFHFTLNTPQELKQALKELGEIKGLILDLRDNPGGPLSAVIEVADQFLESGIIVSQVDNRGNKKVWEAKPGGLATQPEMVVLINRYSASGSEVLAAALQDNGRALLIGERTYGKGSMGAIYPLSDGSGLFLTIARWLTPQGKLIDREGIFPDIIIKLTLEDYLSGKDPQLQYALDYLSSS